jgi:hypothetical protein
VLFGLVQPGPNLVEPQFMHFVMTIFLSPDKLVIGFLIISFTPPVAVFFAAGFLAAGFFAAAFFAAGFFVTAFLAAGFFATGFLAIKYSF